MDVTDLGKRINILLPNDKLEEIVIHSSYPQDSVLRKRNKEYYVWGRSIIKAAYIIYLYLNNPGITDKELTDMLAGASAHFEEKIYSRYELEDFVLKSKGEEGVHHEDISSKLLVLIYQEYGFIECYDFLFPFFADNSELIVTDYKTLLQNYAQANGKTPIYNIIGTSGPDHEKIYTCGVTVGDYKAIGTAIGKRKAEKAAAMQFARKYHVEKEKHHTQARVLTPKPEISEKRKQELETVCKLLSINPHSMSLRQLDIIMTHSSYANEHRNYKNYCNTGISTVGSYILDMVSAEYVFDHYDITKTSVVKERAALFREENFAACIPNGCLKYIHRTSSNDNESAKNKSKTSVIKSAVGVMWINAIRRKNKALGKYANKFGCYYLSKNTNDQILDYKTFLQEIVQSLGCTQDYEFKTISHNSDNSFVFASKVIINHKDWTEIGHGAGGSKKAASNAAAKDVLPSMLRYCNNPDIEDSILRILNPEFYFEYKKQNASIQLGTSDKTQFEQSDQLTPDAAKSKNKSHEPSSTATVPQDVSFDSNEHVLYVCKGTTTCRKKEHSIVSTTGIIASLNGDPIKININYCQNCRIYFIGLREYKYYQNIYGVLLGNISITQYISGGSSGYDSLANESVLRLSGYTVNQADALTPNQRRLILSNLMDRGIISKYRIIEYLQFFINNSKYRTNMKVANRKWSDDLEWVRQYNIDKQRQYIISAIRKQP